MIEERRQRATGRTEVKSYVPTKFDELAGAPTLVDVQVTETFSGDIEGEGVVRVIQAARQGGATTFVGIERVRGTIAGRRGTFLLQVSGRVFGQEMRAEWFVLDGSGTGELAGLRGKGGFTAQLGRRGSIWLDYFFA